MGAPLIQLGLLAAIVLSLVMAFMSYKTTRIYNIILMFMVFCATLPLIYLAARTLKTHQSWRVEVKREEKELADLVKEIQKVSMGDFRSAYAEPVGRTADSPPGAEYAGSSIRELELELHRLAIERGGLWRDVQATKITAADGTVALTVNSPEPHGMAEKMVVFIFDGTQYLGEFKVTKAGKEKTVTLAPNLEMDASDLRHLADSRGDWTIFQTMPIDDPTALASITDDERRKLLPKDSLEKMADATRKPVNYQYIYHDNNQRRILTEAEIVQIKENIPRLEGATAKAEEEVKYREQEKADLEFDLKNFQRERKAVIAYIKQLQDAVVVARNELKAVYLSTRKEAAEVAELQLKAAEKINRQSNREQAALPAAQP